LATLRSSLEDTRKNLKELERKQAAWGELFTPAHLLVQIDEYKEQIAALEKQIRDLS
jgi:predicted  nucleic acid-binding Zn-ribbon protein